MKLVIDLSDIKREIDLLVDVGWLDKHELVELIRLISLALQNKSSVVENLTALETVIKASFDARSSKDMVNYSANYSIVIQNVIAIAKHLIAEYDRLGMYSTDGICRYVLHTFDKSNGTSVLIELGQ